LLALSLGAGLSPDDLWRVTGLFGAGVASLVALLAYELALGLRKHLHSRPRMPSSLCGATAGLVAGLTWAFSPLAVQCGRRVLSDEPTTFVAVGSLIMLTVALTRDRGRRGSALAALAAGLLGGLASAMRPIEGALLLLPAGALVAAGSVRWGLEEASRRLLPVAAGATLVPLIVFALLYRSGLSLLPWSGYSFWVPDFASFESAFGLHFALEPKAGLGAGGSAISHLQLGVGVLLGASNVPIAHSAGRYWPAMAWLIGAGIWWFLWRHRRGSRWLISGIAGAQVVWALGHLAVFSCYFFPAGRFYLSVLPLLAVLFGAGAALGVSWLQRGWPVGLVLLAVGLGLWFRPWWKSASRTARVNTFQPSALEVDVQRRVAEWRALDDRSRAQTSLRFDPVYAQALGLLPPAVVEGVEQWGHLPQTWHVRALERTGRLPPRSPEPAPTTLASESVTP
jgi:hypothetical protein